jgi:hypothetical protein
VWSLRLRFSDDWGIIELAEAERRIQELNALIECQRQIVEESEQRDYDATSATIVLESLQVSLSLYAQALDRLQIILPEQAA